MAHVMPGFKPLKHPFENATAIGRWFLAEDLILRQRPNQVVILRGIVPEKLAYEHNVANSRRKAEKLETRKILKRTENATSRAPWIRSQYLKIDDNNN